MDFSDLVPLVAEKLGVAPSTLLLILFVVVKGANTIARVIPDDATGWRGAARKVATVIGIYVPSRLTAGISIADVAKAALTTPPIPAKVEEVKAAEAGDVPAPRAGQPNAMPLKAGTPPPADAD